MSIHLLPQPDDLEMRPVKSWAAEKLDYLERYLAMFTVSMRDKPWRALNYIDLFAGPGKCQEESGAVSLGSPLLALTTSRPFDHYFFVDLSANNIEVLQQRCQSSPYVDRVNYYVEDCNVAVNQIVEEIQYEDSCYLEGRWSCLNLAFLDPEGLEVHWETVKTLAQSRTDLIIHYSQMGLQRYMPIAIDDPSDTAIDHFFGTRVWRNIYHQCVGTSRVYSELMRFYKQNLSTLGYTEVRSEEELWRVPLMRNTKNAPLYCLIFASKHRLGDRFWREVTNRDVHGQQRLF